MLIGSIPNVVGKDTILYLRKSPEKVQLTLVRHVLMVFCTTTLCPRFPINDGCRSDGNGNGWRQI